MVTVYTHITVPITCCHVPWHHCTASCTLSNNQRLPKTGHNRKQGQLSLAETLHVIPTEDSDWSVWVSGERAVVNIIGGRDRKQLAVGDWSIRAKKGRYAGGSCIYQCGSSVRRLAELEESLPRQETISLYLSAYWRTARSWSRRAGLRAYTESWREMCCFCTKSSNLWDICVDFCTAELGVTTSASRLDKITDTLLIYVLLIWSLLWNLSQTLRDSINQIDRLNTNVLDCLQIYCLIETVLR